ncbi:MAG: DUF4136 domain-containing protein [Acidobacteriota bacterium]|nr:MAG: DUF4136 domain-containing protein [Acidobacteriota bacterium]
MNNYLRIGSILFLLLFSSACDLKTTVDYDRNADFSAVKTYAWAEQEQAEINDLNQKRIVSAVESQLALKGLKAVDSDPDVYVAYFTDDDEQVVVDTTHMGYGYGPGMYWDPFWGGGMGMSTSTSRVRTYTQGTLVVDLYHADEKQLVWRGVVTATVNEDPRKLEKQINKGVAKLFKKYPPAEKS